MVGRSTPFLGRVSGPAWDRQILNYSLHLSARGKQQHLTALWSRIGNTPCNPSDHHTTIALKCLQGAINCPPLCQEDPVSRTADARFPSQGGTLSTRGVTHYRIQPTRIRLYLPFFDCACTQAEFRLVLNLSENGKYNSYSVCFISKIT